MPRTATGDSAIWISTFSPGTAVCRRRSVIIDVIRILDPFPDIAMHIKKPERIWWKLSHRDRLVPPRGLALAICAEVGVFVSGHVAPRIRRMRCIGTGDA